jgi:hypothetical protein
MKKILNTYDIANELLADENADWSRAGAFALAEYLEDLEEDSWVDMELDVVAIRCEFNEYSTALEAALEYLSMDEIVQRRDAIDNLEGSALEYLHENTMVYEFDGGVIVSSF